MTHRAGFPCVAKRIVIVKEGNSVGILSNLRKNGSEARIER
jgi:hypothetical protein